jgi:hypothetical protein
MYRARQKEIDIEGMQITQRIDAIDNEWSETRNKITEEVKRASTCGTRITIVVMASGDGEAELSLTYMVSNARWSPQYDVRAAIAKDAKSQSTVGLHYRASISQRTGEDWTNVELTLSTASPQQGTVIPKLRPQWISVPVPVPYQPPAQSVAPRTFVPPPIRLRSASPPPAISIREPSSDGEEQAWERSRALRRRETFVGDTWTSSANQVSRPPDFFAPNNSNATDGAVSTTFIISGVSTIPSASDDGQQTHKVSIAELDFSSVDMQWITVPKEVTSVFLQVSPIIWQVRSYLTCCGFSWFVSAR